MYVVENKMDEGFLFEFVLVVRVARKNDEV